jgi:hypothetical protein
VQLAFVHQVATDIRSGVLFEEDVVGEDDGGAATRVFALRVPQGAVNVLQEGELFVARGVGEILPGGAASSLLGTKGWVGEDDVGLG